MLPVLGWRMIWRAAGVLVALFIVPLALWVLHDRPRPQDGEHYLTADGRPMPTHHGSRGESDLTWSQVVRRRTFWILVAAFLPMLALWGGSSNNLGPIVSSQGLSTQTAGVLLSAFSLSHVASTVIMGMLADRFGVRLPLLGLALATAVGGFCIAFGHSTTSLGIGVILVGLSGGMWPLIAAAVAAEFGERDFGRAFGLLMIFLPVIVLVPFGVAKIKEATGSYVIGLVGLAVLTSLGGVACLFMREERVDSQQVLSSTRAS
jgi:MFS family permease